jgi:hypothetical protein
MATILGPHSLIDIAVPTGVDAAEVFRWELMDGMTGADVMALAAQVIGMENQAIMAKYGGLLNITNRMFARYRQGEGERTYTPEWAEFEAPTGVRAQQIGHMLPLKWYRDATSWSLQFLEDANRDDIGDDIELIRERWRNRFDKMLWTRVLTDTENLVGDAGYDVGWAIGTGTNVNYIPPQHAGFDAFDSTHTHYLYKDDDSNDWGDLLDAMALELIHHGHIGLLTAFISFADIAEYDDVDGYVELKPENMLIVSSGADMPVNPGRYMTGTQEGVPGELFGYYRTKYGNLVELRWMERIPTNYCFMTKVYGNQNPKNALAVRVSPRRGFGMTVDPQMTSSVTPELEYIKFPSRFGIGVNQRTNGVAGYLAAAASAWVDATVT